MLSAGARGPATRGLELATPTIADLPLSETNRNWRQISIQRPASTIGHLREQKTLESLEGIISIYYKYLLL